MKKQKLYSELYSVDDWLEYYKGASKYELRARLKSLGGRDRHLTSCKDHERQAIIAWLQ